VKRLGWAMSAALMAAAGQAGAAEHVVRIVDNAYEPASLQAKVGDTIRFVNEDADWHAVFVPTAAFALDLGQQEQGEETTLTLTRPSTFEVECVHHMSMLMTVQVEP
jgi:plastocyanin